MDKCRKCYWWGDPRSPRSDSENKSDYDLREKECFRHPPQTIVTRDGAKSYRPLMKGKDYCGEFKEKFLINDKNVI